ncbi:hypothetical protein Aspvir_001724 [Aspergillus viridinutans]|uniref:LysM domain-containing protein n=1 Tax=Aspergillus viridinutans TaxID=75553 RepID=A0A9P3F2Z7_ASPVI|nr:uncharacterized protein Aspvir_001724 [Aspergillus viridinutans]GIJ99590.1 hypothetical protein Aspvir_001724 [Aspergillus viridinutans]
MKLSPVLRILICPLLVGAYLVSPPGTAAPGTTADCSEWIEYSSSLTCALIEQLFGMTEAEFEEWNPIVTELGTGCALISGLYYCVQVNFTTVTVSSSNPFTTTSGGSTSGTAVATTSASTSAIATPTPYETGMVSDCDAFHLVVSGDTCATIASSAGISVSNFETWNPTVGFDCSGLWLDYYVCIGIVGGASSTAATSTPTTTTGNGISTPTPYESGMVDDCDEFYLVVSGDSCASIASTAGISVTDFETWNPTIGSGCSGLWLGYYVCVGITGGTTTTTTTTVATTTTSAATTTTSGNGVTTPTPYQSGMVDDCYSFHLVVSGDSCAVIADDGDITLDEFYLWNPTVGTSCSSLWLGYHVCIGIL